MLSSIVSTVDIDRGQTGWELAFDMDQIDVGVGVDLRKLVCLILCVMNV